MNEGMRDFPRVFGQRLRRCRRNRDRTQADIAAAIGMERAQYSQLEAGRYRSMQLHQIARLADSLNTSLDYLFLRTDDDPGVIPPWRCHREEPDSRLSWAPLRTTPPMWELRQEYCTTSALGYARAVLEHLRIQQVYNYKHAGERRMECTRAELIRSLEERLLFQHEELGELFNARKEIEAQLRHKEQPHKLAIEPIRKALMHDLLEQGDTHIRTAVFTFSVHQDIGWDTPGLLLRAKVTPIIMECYQQVPRSRLLSRL